MDLPEERWQGADEDAALAAIVRSSQDAVIAKTPDGTITAWNSGAERLYGYRAAEVVGRDIAVTFPPEAAAEERERHARVARGHPQSGYRCTRVRDDGQRVEVVMSMLPVRDPGGAVVGLASISRPVNAEERAAERLAMLLASAPDAILEVLPDGRVSMVNDRALELFGRTAEEVTGLAVDVLVPGLLAQVTADGGGPGSVLVAGRHRDGTTSPLEVNTARSVDGSLVVTLRDVTVQQQREAQLRESETRLRQLAENVSTVFTLRQLDPPAYLYVSPAIEALTGYTAEDLYDDPEIALTQLIHPDDREKAAQLRRPDLVGTGSFATETRIVTTDGQVKWVRVLSSPVPDPSGVPQRVVGMAEDVSDRVLATQRLAAAEAEARSANEAKNLFLSRMSHELRTPLNAILGFGQLLALKLASTPHEDSVHHVVQAGRHLLALIDDALDIARIESGEMPLSLEPVDVRELVDECLRLLSPIASAAGVRLANPLVEGPAFAVADTQRLRQVVLNLLTNAVKYNRRGGSVQVSCRHDGTSLRLQVSDDGPGIAADVRHRLFTPFDRLGAERTPVEGTGVGLALSRALVELMNGTIELDPTSGTGASFVVALPASHPTGPDAERDGQGAAGAARAPAPPRTLLYVEDNTANVAVMQAVLELRPEWRFVHAALGGLALDLARAHQPDLVLLDLHLPDGNGLDVLRALRQDPQTRSIDVVVLSADASRSTIRRVLEAGARDYLTKPYDLDRLLEVLDHPTRG